MSDDTTLRPSILRPPEPKPSWHRPVGLALTVPAFALLLVAYVWPVLWTFRASVKLPERVIPLRRGAAGEPGGFTFANYSDLFADSPFPGDLLTAFLLALVPIVAVLIAAPLLAFAAHRAGTRARRLSRGLLSLPLAAYAPSALIATRI